MTSFENFRGHKLMQVASFEKFRKYNLPRLTSFQDSENKKKKIIFYVTVSFNCDINRGCLVYMFSLRFLGSKFFMTATSYTGF